MKFLCKNADLLEENLKRGTKILIEEYKHSAEHLEIFVEFQENKELSVK